jgi:hypothetical protein
VIAIRLARKHWIGRSAHGKRPADLRMWPIQGLRPRGDNAAPRVRARRHSSDRPFRRSVGSGRVAQRRAGLGGAACSGCRRRAPLPRAAQATRRRQAETPASACPEAHPLAEAVPPQDAAKADAAISATATATALAAAATALAAAATAGAGAACPGSNLVFRRRVQVQLGPLPGVPAHLDASTASDGHGESARRGMGQICRVARRSGWEHRGCLVVERLVERRRRRLGDVDGRNLLHRRLAGELPHRLSHRVVGPEQPARVAGAPNHGLLLLRRMEHSLGRSVPQLHAATRLACDSDPRPNSSAGALGGAHERPGTGGRIRLSPS